MSSKVKTFLGVDWGGKRIGLAIGDSGTRLASPFKVVGDVEELCDIAYLEEVDGIVLGKPLKMYDADEELDKDYIAFVEELQKKIDIPIIQVDERLTSKHADSLPGNRKTKAKRDAIAAMLILQSHLDSLRDNEED
jgi:putative holliday junction resolvase